MNRLLISLFKVNELYSFTFRNNHKRTFYSSNSTIARVQFLISTRIFFSHVPVQQKPTITIQFSSRARNSIISAYGMENCFPSDETNFQQKIEKSFHYKNLIITNFQSKVL